MRTTSRFSVPDPACLDGLTDHCPPRMVWLLRGRILRTHWTAARPGLLPSLTLLIAAVAFSRGWPAAVAVGSTYLLVVAGLAVWVAWPAVPVRPGRRHGRRAAYVLSDGRAVIEARVTRRGVVELSNHAKLSGTSAAAVRAMRRGVVTAILETDPAMVVRGTTRVPALAQLYAEDLDAVARALGLDRCATTRPVRGWEHLIGLRTEVRL